MRLELGNRGGFFSTSKTDRHIRQKRHFQQNYHLSSAHTKKFGAKVILPEFTIAHKDEMPTDFNDLHKLSGIHEVQRQIQSHQVIINHEHQHDLQI